MSPQQLEMLRSTLEGQCLITLEQAFEIHDIPDTIDNRQQMDEVMFLCEICDWWCPIEELTDNQTCEDCT